ncbi:MAG: hypothetical protein ACK4RK_15915 [Gemmataceae bacterium]
MTDSHEPALASTPVTESGSFSEETIQAFHGHDRHAAAAVVLLMMAIFSMGLVGYSAVAIWVYQSSW